MDRKKRPVARKKIITEGSADVFRRGDAVDVGGKPKGAIDGYADRKSSGAKSWPSRSNRSGRRTLGTDLISGLVHYVANSANKQDGKAKGSLKKIIVIAVIIG